MGPIFWVWIKLDAGLLLDQFEEFNPKISVLFPLVSDNAPCSMEAFMADNSKF